MFIGRRRGGLGGLGGALGGQFSLKLLLGCGLHPLGRRGFDLGQQFGRHRGTEFIDRGGAARGGCGSGGRRRGLGAATFRIGVQVVDQFLIVAFRLGTRFLELAQQVADAVQAFENERHRLGRDFQLAVAELAEHVLTGMGHRFQTRQPQEPAGPLDGMDQTENVPENCLIVRFLFELDQFDIEHGKVFRGLGKEFSEKVVHLCAPGSRRPRT